MSLISPDPIGDRPSLWEIVRRIGLVEDRLDHARENASRTYLRRETWEEARRGDGLVTANLATDIADLRAGKADNSRVDAVVERVEDLEGTRASDTTFRRQVQLALALAAITSMVAIGLAIVPLLLAG